MSDKEKSNGSSGLNGLKKFLIGLGVVMLAGFGGQTLMLYQWKGEVTTQLRYMQKQLDNHADQIAELRGRDGES